MIFTDKKESPSCGCATQVNAASVCPQCHQKGSKVEAVTVQSQLKKEPLSNMHSTRDAFNFCTNPVCDTVYYADDGSESFGQKEIKSKVTLKNDDPKTPLCYCKKLLKGDVLAMIEKGEPDIAEKVKAIIANGKSFCEKSNPKGTCCTDDVKNFLAGFGISWEKPKKQMFSMMPPSSCCSSSGCC
ncbi:hypothetical protein [Sulfurimonas sp. HSL3-7]|uniref:hypothetical protein n=1 Tax=Sulfonitrofixus jiaomeiensis TaxID=3131938 RepID=UPI0031F96563